MKELPFRIAMREEGDKWNAYFAPHDTMDGAIWIGSIAMQFVVSNERRKKAFINLMTGAVAEIIEAEVGAEPDWIEKSAPESERTKE